MKEIGLAAGYDHRIQDNFFARSYNHSEFKDYNHTYEGAYNFRFWRMGYKYTAFIDNVADIWQCWIYAFIFLAIIQMVK